MQIKTLLLLLIISLFSSCSSKDAKHLNVFQLPGAVIDNALYNSKREKVEAYVQAHYEVLREEIKKEEGTHLNEALTLAKVEKKNRLKAKQSLKKDYKTIFHNTQIVSEKLSNAMVQLYWKKKKLPTVNGFNHEQIYNIVDKYIDQNFEAIRLAVKSKKSKIFEPLADKLNIKEADKREKFTKTLNGRYYELYVDILVVSIMMHGV